MADSLLTRMAELLDKAVTLLQYADGSNETPEWHASRRGLLADYTALPQGSGEAKPSLASDFTMEDARERLENMICDLIAAKDRGGKGALKSRLRVAKSIDDYLNSLAALNATFPKGRPAGEQRHLTITTNESGECCVVSWQDDEHRILEIVWEAK